MRLAACDQGNAKFAASLELSFGLFAGANLRRAGAAVARRIGSASSAARAPPK